MQKYAGRITRWAVVAAIVVLLVLVSFASGWIFAGEKKHSAKEEEALTSQTESAVESEVESEAESVVESQAESQPEASEPEEELPDTVEELPWNLLLVNRDHPLSDDFKPELGTLSNGYEVDARIVDAAEAMMQGAADAGYSVYCTSGYRDYYLQWTLLENKISRVTASTGLEGQEAFDEAKMVVALPGTSEHQTGLAMDLLCGSYSSLDEGIADTEEIQWCVEHCAEYGFILRFPKDQTDITGIVYEPWHFRYVGVEAATVIMEEGITLETYLQNVYGIE